MKKTKRVASLIGQRRHTATGKTPLYAYRLGQPDNQTSDWSASLTVTNHQPIGEEIMSDLTMNLPTEIVERAVRDKINAAIAEQLGDPEEMIKKLVGAALSQKVSSNGAVGRSDYDNKFEFLDLLAGNFMRDAAKEALTEFFEENRKAIKDAVKKEVARSPSKMAKIFMDGITKSMTSVYTPKVDIVFKTESDY